VFSKREGQIEIASSLQLAITSCIQVSMSSVCDAVKENWHLTNKEVAEEIAYVPQLILNFSDFCQVCLLHHDIVPAYVVLSVYFLLRDSSLGIVIGY
jgi:hypothetical protein